MRKINLLIGLLVFAVASTFGQTKDYSFKVLAAKGNNQFLTKGQWANLSAGATLNKGEKVKVTEGGYIGLIHSTGKTMELKTSGTFDVAELESKVISSKTNFGEKYGDFVADGMFASNPDAKNSFKETGSVHRGAKTPIFVYAPKEIQALKSEPLTLHWNKCGGKHVFEISLSDFFGEVIYTTKSDTNFAVIDFSKIKLSSDEDMDTKGSYLLTIKSLTDPSYSTSSGSSDSNNKNGYSYTVKIVDDATALKATTEIKKVKSQMNTNSAMDYMFLAAVYEKQDLMTYAVDSYAKAQSLAPNVDHFKTQYEEYIKTKLNEKSLLGSKEN